MTEIPGLPRQGEAAVRVLVVDDDETVAEVVVRYLQRAGLLVDRAADGVTALAVAQRSRPDLVVLDLMLPGLTGLEVCERLRAGRPDLPVVMLTALGAEDDRIAGLQLGADDYLVKPFSPRELVVDVGARTAVRAGRELALTSREFDLLVHLMAHPDTVLSREQLMRQVWGWDFGDTSTVTVHVRRLREKVEQDPSQPRHLVTVWGVGYRWQGATATPPAGEPREAVR